MSNNYKEKLKSILLTVRPRLLSTHTIEFKNSFGAVAGYLDKNIFIVYGKFGLALKLPQVTIDKLFQERIATPFKYFEKGHVKKEYAVISSQVIKKNLQLKKIIDKSIEFVLK